MQIIQAPNYRKAPNGVPTLFLAGGISGCHNWQSEAIQQFKRQFDNYEQIAIYNPRRDVFDITNPNMSSEQIEWEFKYLHKVDVLFFWFPPETLCPITLFELGNALNRTRTQKMIVGIDPLYQRKFDIEKQCELFSKAHWKQGYDIDILYSLEDTVLTTSRFIRNTWDFR